ncbi:MAG: DUF2059 domain-containing protein [Blastochloris sp.]|nr:DUF2059 domain-containing protein [Blastochloris sp.]
MKVTEVEKTIDSVLGQMDSVMKSSMDMALQGQAMNADSKALQEKLQSRMATIIKEEMSWDKMKDFYIQVYAENFTQEEIDGMIAFYDSPIGKAVTAKMPQVTIKSMTQMQQRMGPLMERIQKVTKEIVEESKLAPKKG